MEAEYPLWFSIFLVVIALWMITVIVISLLKGKYLMTLVGLFFLGNLIVWTVGAVRLAKPRSWWARRRYDEDKMLKARERHGMLGQAARDQRRMGPAAHRCAICGMEFGDPDDALEHAEVQHPEVRLSEAIVDIDQGRPAVL